MDGSGTKIDKANKLDEKTKGLTYLAVLAATRLEGGIPFMEKWRNRMGRQEKKLSAVFWLDYRQLVIQ
jgi:alkylhydroperoxidase/carboxymuconolactone decarboxylase family protein YurZ